MNTQIQNKCTANSVPSNDCPSVDVPFSANFSSVSTNADKKNTHNKFVLTMKKGLVLLIIYGYRDNCQHISNARDDYCYIFY